MSAIEQTGEERGRLTRSRGVREANDHIAARARALRFVSRVPMLCECADPGCRSVVLIALEAYHQLRQTDRLVLAPGHESHMGGARIDPPTFCL